jgi:ABC-2 type transport system ATP-binding protein
VIEVKNLVKRYGKHNAVDHLSFTVEDGQIFGFLGPNGAGKSTTMNIMTGYLAATEGDVVIEGHNIRTEPEAAKACVGYLPELPPLYGDMTVGEYLRFVAELKRLPAAERENQIGRAVALTHLEDVSGRLIRNLSKGYRQRVGLAQAILGFPKIIILDEPTVGLDPKQVVEIRDLIRHLAQDHTVLLSSHILSEVRAVCDHVLIIRKGRLVACDTPQHLEETLSSGEHRLTLLARGTQDQAAAVLAGVAGVSGSSAAEEDGAVRIELTAARDVREDLFYAFAQARCPLLELRPLTATLEDVFLDLTDDDDTVAARAAALLGGAAGEAPAAEAAPAQQVPEQTEEKEDADDAGNL